MPSLKEVLERENAPRPLPHDVRTVRLIKMGNFIRAYDWSAWLLKRQGSTLNVGLDGASGDRHLFVGFPVASIDKFQPEGSEVVKDAEELPTEWIFHEENFPPEEAHGHLELEYETWRNESIARLESEQAEKREKRKEKNKTQDAERPSVRGTEADERQESRSAHPLRLTDIAREILRFRLDENSPAACVDFLRRVQSNILDLL